MKTRPIVTVQQLNLPDHADGRRNTGAILRLRGKWIAQVFPPSTRVRVTHEERNGKLALVLEEVTR